MTRSVLLLNPLLLGLAVTLAQVGIAVFLLAPEGPLWYRYSSLVQHDSYWFANIIERGYQTIVPPISHKTMEISNVAFFPAYPAIAAVLRYGLRIETDKALLVTAQAATVGFWSYFFLFCQKWDLSPTLRFFGALSILAHPAAFFLVAGYSESLFLMAVVGFIYWAGREGRAANMLAVLHGILMWATRIVGIPCAAAPLVQRICAQGWEALRRPREWVRLYGRAIALTIVATIGAVSFFLYCQLRWGHWDIYMLTQSSGWAISPDYLAVFRPSSYRWVVPALNDPTAMSQMSVTTGALFFIVVAACELVPAIRRSTNWPVRISLYFCAAIIFYISVSGVASVAMESMVRYHFAVHALIVLALLHFLRQFTRPPVYVRALGMAAVALASVAGLTLQGWYIWNFTRGNWVA
ncbi:MAG TPA: hypothetical protein VE758_02635 [Chthoniobacterales bacterium]|nr:hypothetical protein [Chthoniobacterales bacterium]